MLGRLVAIAIAVTVLIGVAMAFYVLFVSKPV